VDTANTELPPPATHVVTALYAEHALGLIRLAVIMLGDQAAAEDVVQDAFLGLYRRWDSLADASNPIAYLRASVLNGCRSALRARSRRLSVVADAATTESAEAIVLLSEEHRSVVTAIRGLPTSMYWVDGDRALAFPAEHLPASGTQGKAGPLTERLLDVTASGGDLIADSRVIWTAPTNGCGQPLLVTADGKTLVCTYLTWVALGGTGNNTRLRNIVRFEAYSVQSATVRTLYQVTVDTPQPEGASLAVLWASPSGDKVIVDWGFAKDTVSPGNLGVVSHGTFTRLPPVPSFFFLPGPAW